MGEGAESDGLIGRTLGKKFLVRRRLGSGGMGAVYEAEHLLTKRVGALKLLHPDVASSAKTVERFLREASAAGRIGNAHIVETIDAGELPSGETYTFMELLDGTPVSELIKRQRRLSFEEACEIVIQAAEGLAAAHSAGIVHRDVKPENLFLCRGEPAYVKLLDFGISRFDTGADHRLTTEGAPMGTPYYMSPEQVAGKRDIGPASDIYSLGVVLYECVTGCVPFDAATLPALSIKIFEGNYAPPSSVCGAPAAALDAIVARAMATAPSQRYASMAEFREALACLRRGAAVSLTQTLENLGSTVVLGELGSAVDVDQVGAPAAVQQADSLTPPTLPSAPARGVRGAWVVAGSVALLAAGGAALNRGHVPVPAPSQDASLPSAPVPVPAAVAVVTSGAAPSLSSSAAESGPLPPAKPAPRPGASSQRASSPSKAARDGLSEKNPFE